MATDWAAESKVFYDDIREDGFEITVRHPGSPGTFNPDTLSYDDAVSPSDVSTYAIKGCYSAFEIDGTMVQVGDSVLYVPSYGLSVEITPDTQILVDSVVQNIISVQKHDPANVVIGYRVQVRS